MRRSALLAPVVALVLTISAIAAVWFLVGQASASRGAQLQVSSMRLSLAGLGIVPFSADPASGGSPSASEAKIRLDEASLAGDLTWYSAVAKRELGKPILAKKLEVSPNDRTPHGVSQENRLAYIKTLQELPKIHREPVNAIAMIGSCRTSVPALIV